MKYWSLSDKFPRNPDEYLEREVNTFPRKYRKLFQSAAIIEIRSAKQYIYIAGACFSTNCFFLTKWVFLYFFVFPLIDSVATYVVQYAPAAGYLTKNSDRYLTPRESISCNWQLKQVALTTYPARHLKSVRAKGSDKIVRGNVLTSVNKFLLIHIAISLPARFPFFLSATLFGDRCRRMIALRFELGETLRKSRWKFPLCAGKQLW